MKRAITLLCLSFPALVLASCGGSGSSSNPNSSSSSDNSFASASASESTSEATSESSSSQKSHKTSEPGTSLPLDDFISIDTEGGAVSRFGDVYTITAAGTYTASGTKYGQIIIDAGDEDQIELHLNGVDLSCDYNSPILILNADGVDISAMKDTENVITDERELKTEDDEEQGNGAIYAKCDLKLKSTGSLKVVGSYNNGVHTTKDLTIQKLNLHVTAPNNALKGNDSITVKSGNITAISTGGDGLKTEDSDISAKGNQRGTIEILDGTLDIYSACDGIDASYDAVISGGTTTIVTNKYSSYTGEIVESSTTSMYLRTKTANSSSYRYAVYFYDDEGRSVWSNASFVKKIESGGGPNSSTYYYFELERPANYNNFKVYRFSSSQTENSTEEGAYEAASKGGTINANYDTVTITVSGTSINTGDWVNYAAQSQGGGGKGPGGPGEGGNSDKSSVSAKGVKADNIVSVTGGNLTITAADDGIHANNDVALDNGEQGLGNVSISGGDIKVASDDDGIHADATLDISGGKINVTKAYEGLEGHLVNISGGESYVKASDDGVNASGNNALITISGGYIFAAVPSNGDTDGFDSNGSITITGGTTIACGPNSSFAASAFDGEGSCKISGSDTTLLIFGGYELTPNGFSKTTFSSSFSANKAYKISYNDVDIVTGTMVSSYSSVNSFSSHGSILSVSAIS